MHPVDQCLTRTVADFGVRGLHKGAKGSKSCWRSSRRIEIAQACPSMPTPALSCWRHSFRRSDDDRSIERDRRRRHRWDAGASRSRTSRDRRYRGHCDRRQRPDRRLFDMGRISSAWMGWCRERLTGGEPELSRISKRGDQYLGASWSLELVRLAACAPAAGEVPRWLYQLLGPATDSIVAVALEQDGGSPGRSLAKGGTYRATSIKGSLTKSSTIRG